MYDLMRAAYPELFPGDDDETWDRIEEYVENFEAYDGLAELLGRVVMLTNPMSSGLTGRLSYCLGTTTIENGSVQMEAAVRRDVNITKPQETL